MYDNAYLSIRADSDGSLATPPISLQAHANQPHAASPVASSSPNLVRNAQGSAFESQCRLELCCASYVFNGLKYVIYKVANNPEIAKYTLTLIPVSFRLTHIVYRGNRGVTC